MEIARGELVEAELDRLIEKRHYRRELEEGALRQRTLLEHLRALPSKASG